MAYATTARVVPMPNGTFQLWIYDTDAASDSEYVIDCGALRIPAVGWVVSQTFDLTDGDASTMQPQLGLVPAATLQTEIVVLATAAEGDTNLAWPPVPYFTTGLLYHRPQPDSGSNNDCITVYLLTNDLAVR